MTHRLREELEARWPIWAAAFLRLWSRTVRQTLLGAEQTMHFSAYCVAHWHGDELALIPRFGALGLTLLVSHSKDGARMAMAARHLGYRVTRGSSSRGAVGGLLALMKALRNGHPVVLAVDGPQGPKGVCKPGIVRLSQKTRTPLFPVGVAAGPRYVFKNTWNQVYLPLPFGRQVVVVGEPLRFPAAIAEEEIAVHCRCVEAAIARAQERAEALLRGGVREADPGSCPLRRGER